MADANESVVDRTRLAQGLQRLMHTQRPRYRRLWAYYKNPMRVCAVREDGADQSTDRPYRQAQEWGLPARITGSCSGSEPFDATDACAMARKEVVIENDIGWRIDTLVDYLFGKPLMISSAAPDENRREQIGKLLRMILAHNGGIQFLQQVALIGAVYGFVDVVVKADFKSSLGGDRTPGTQAEAEPALLFEPSSPAEGGRRAASDEPGRIAGADIGDDAQLARIARMIRLEIVEPARALPMLSIDDYRVMQGYGQVWETGSGLKAAASADNSGGWWNRFKSLWVERAGWPSDRNQTQIIEWITAQQWLRMEDGKVVAHGTNSLGEVPVVHIQNSAQAFEYAGASDVEPLIPLQDELNTRLSDRANRITLQSFKMYLAKGIDDFNTYPVSPGRMWKTDNEEASIDEFGGDANCPSEEAHISDLREALDKTSGVTPIAAGAIKNRIGRLTSAAALRVTLLALLSKTDKKRTSYGAGIERMFELALKWLDVAGVFRTMPGERRIELNWPSPLPENEIEKLQEAELKLKLGVEKDVVLRELGY